MANEMVTTVESIVKDVHERLVSNGTKTLYEVETLDGTKWTTFRQPLANAARALIGKPAVLQCKISKNGDYTNYYIDEIASAAPPAEQAAPSTPKSEPVDFKTFSDYETKKEQAKNESIHRQSAAKTAAMLAPKDANEFWANIGDLLNFFRTGMSPATFQAARQTQVPAQTAPPVYVPASPPPATPVEEPPPYVDDDIPF